MHGVLSVDKATFGPLQTSATTWSNRLTQAAAACNGLIMINRSTVVGDEMESALFKTVEARFLVTSFINLLDVLPVSMLTILVVMLISAAVEYLKRISAFTVAGLNMRVDRSVANCCAHVSGVLLLLQP